MSRKSLIRTALLAPFLVVILTLAGIYAYLQTDSGRAFLVSQVEAAASDAEGISLDLGQLDGNIFSEFSIDSVRLRDPDGEWLSAENITASWSPFDLLSGKLAIGSIIADRLAVAREPRLAPSEESESAGIPELPVDIRLGKLEIREIHIAEPVVGLAADLSLLLNLNAKVDDVIHSEIKLSERNDKSRLLGSVDFDPARETLAIDIRLDEQENGLISRFLALPGYPAIKANVVGNGVFNSWRGQMSMSAGKLFDADFAVATRGEKQITIDLKGGGSLDRSLADDIPLIDDSRITVSATLVYDTKSDDITLSAADIENGTFNVKAEGRVNPYDETIKLSLKSALRDAAPLNDLMAPAAVTSGNLDLDLDGTFSKINVNALLKAGGLDVDGSFAAAELTGTFTSALDLSALTDIPVKGSAALVSLSKLPAEAAALIGENLDIDFELAYGVETERLTVTALRLLGAQASATGKGEFDLASLGATADLSLNLGDLSKVAAIGGSLAADVTLSSSDVSQNLEGKIAARAADIDLGDPRLTPIIGTDPKLALNFSFAGDELRLSDIDMRFASGSVAGTARLPLSFETVEAELTASVPQLARLSEIAETEIGGTAALTANLTGALADPDVKGTFDITKLVVDGNSLGALTGSYALSTLAASPSGNVATRLLHDRVKVEASSTIALPDYEYLTLSNLSVTEQKNRLSGDLKIPFDGTPISGSVKGRVPDLGTLTALLDQDTSGELDFSARLADRKGSQSIEATIAAKSLRITAADVTAANLSVSAAMTGGFDAPTIDVTATADTMAIAGQKLKKVATTAEGSLEALDYTFDITRGEDPDLTLAGTGQLTQKGGVTSVRLATMDGDFAGRKIALTSPLSLRVEGETLELDRFALSFGEGKLQGSGRLLPASVNAEFSFNDLPVDLVELVDPGFDFTGRLNGTGSLTATKGASATGEMTLKAVDLRLVGEEYAELPSFASTVTARLAKGELTFKGDVTGLEATRIDATGRLPFDIALDPTNILINENKPVNIKLKIDSDINKIWPLLALDTQQMKGQLTADLAVEGTINAPQLVGAARINNGYFEDVEQGTILKKLTVTAEIADGDVLKLDAKAVDPQGGELASSGTVNFAKLTNPRVDINVALTNLLVVNRDDFSIITDGKIDLEGNTSDLYVDGQVTTRNVEINIGGSVAPNVVDLKYEEVNRPGAEKVEKTIEQAEPSRISLDLDLHMPSRVFIRGRGLDSEWKGNFVIRGTADDPRIEGYISPVRGQFNFAGKSFELTEGEISLIGGDTINPELSLKAQYTGPNVTAIVTISGTASNPTISFSSPDDLPQDEVLSQVLFGRSSGKLSAVEAVQLAETLAALSGKMGSGGGITGFVRDTLGVDVVSASTNEQTGEAEVSVGKYVSDNIYVGVDQGTQSGGTRAKVQIELTPNISVESEMGQSTDSSVGIFWKWDY